MKTQTADYPWSHRLIRRLMASIRKPRRVHQLIGNNSIQFSTVEYGDEKVMLSEVSHGRIFTDTAHNISVLQGRSLIPWVSSQYHNFRSLPDRENFLLSGKIRLHEPPLRLKGTLISLLNGETGKYNYYHWLYDCLAKLKLLEGRLQHLSAATFLVPNDKLPFQRQTLEMFGITDGMYISSLDHNYIAADTIVASTNPNCRQQTPSWAIRFLRDQLLGSSATFSSRGGECLYITRSDSQNARRPSNEAAIEARLKSAGFRILTLSEISVDEQISLFASARLIVGVHGAGLTNLTFSRPGTMVYELVGTDYAPDMFVRISDYIGLDHQRLFCDQLPDASLPMTRGLVVPDAALETIIASARSILDP